MRSRAFRVECVDQPFEGQVGVLERAEVAFANLGEDVLERRVGRDLCSQHKSVDEHTDQVIEFGLAAAGDGCPDGDVLGTGQARRKYRQCCVHEHEHGGAVLTCQVGQRPMGLRRYREPVDRADHGRLCRTWERRRQRDRLAQSRESVLPVIELTGQSRVRIFLGAEHFVLPHSEVAVLHGQFRPVRRTAGTAGRVSRCHVRCEGVHRDPSATMWWTTITSTCLRSSPSTRRTAQRIGTSAEASKPAEASSRIRSDTLAAVTISGSRIGMTSSLDITC